MKLIVEVVDGAEVVSPLCQRQTNPVGLQPMHPDKHVGYLPGVKDVAGVSYFVSLEQRNRIIDFIKQHPIIQKVVKIQALHLGGSFRLFFSIRYDILNPKTSSEKFLTYDDATKNHIETALTWVCFALDFAGNCLDERNDTVTASLQTIFPLDAQFSLFPEEKRSDPNYLAAKGSHANKVIAIELRCGTYTYRRHLDGNFMSLPIYERLPSSPETHAVYKVVPSYSYDSSNNPLAYDAERQSNLTQQAQSMAGELSITPNSPDFSGDHKRVERSIKTLEKAICSSAGLIDRLALLNLETNQQQALTLSFKSVTDLSDVRDMNNVSEALTSIGERIEKVKEVKDRINDVKQGCKTHLFEKIIGNITDEAIDKALDFIIQQLRLGPKSGDKAITILLHSLTFQIPGNSKLKKIEQLLISSRQHRLNVLQDYVKTPELDRINEKIRPLIESLSEVTGALKNLQNQLIRLEESREAQDKINKLIAQDESLAQRTFARTERILLSNQRALEGNHPLEPADYRQIIESLLKIQMGDNDDFALTRIYDDAIEIKIYAVKESIGKALCNLYAKLIKGAKDEYPEPWLNSTIGQYLKKNSKGDYELNDLFYEIPGLEHEAFCEKIEEAIEIIHKIYEYLLGHQNQMKELNPLIKSTAECIEEYKNLRRHYPYVFMLRAQFVNHENIKVILQHITSGLLDRLASEKAYTDHIRAQSPDNLPIGTDVHRQFMTGLLMAHKSLFPVDTAMTILTLLQTNLMNPGFVRQVNKIFQVQQQVDLRRQAATITDKASDDTPSAWTPLFQWSQPESCKDAAASNSSNPTVVA